jgi:hypothetical protein
MEGTDATVYLRQEDGTTDDSHAAVHDSCDCGHGPEGTTGVSGRDQNDAAGCAAVCRARNRQWQTAA